MKEMGASIALVVIGWGTQKSVCCFGWMISVKETHFFFKEINIFSNEVHNETIQTSYYPQTSTIWGLYSLKPINHLSCSSLFSGPQPQPLQGVVGRRDVIADLFDSADRIPGREQWVNEVLPQSSRLHLGIETTLHSDHMYIYI